MGRRGFIRGLRVLLWIFFIGMLGCGGTMMSSESTTNPNTEDDGFGAPAPMGPQPFDLDLALELGRLCLQSYQMLDDFNKGVTFTLPAPYQLIKVFSTNESFSSENNGNSEVPIAFVATKGENIYVVFRGTDTIIEWIDDAEIGQKAYTFAGKGALTEVGFTDIYATIHTQILATVAELVQQGGFSQLLITGHSLGAGLAVLAVPEFAAKSGFSHPIFYNFAGPRVGDPKFANQLFDSLGITAWRVANTNDLVPGLPKPVVVIFENNQPKTFFYEHVNQQKSITFGNPVTSPLDTKDIEFNHIMCNYYNTLCEMTDQVETCKQAADGADGCNPS